MSYLVLRNLMEKLKFTWKVYWKTRRRMSLKFWYYVSNNHKFRKIGDYKRGLFLFKVNVSLKNIPTFVAFTLVESLLLDELAVECAKWGKAPFLLPIELLKRMWWPIICCSGIDVTPYIATPKELPSDLNTTEKYQVTSREMKANH